MNQLSVGKLRESKQERMIGLDVARAFAIFGMIIVNFNLVLGVEPSGVGKIAYESFLQGRAAALFIVLAGMGFALFACNKTSCQEGGLDLATKTELLMRSVVLFISGLCFYQIWPADILHFYGVSMLVAIPLVSMRVRWLAHICLVTVILSAWFIVAFDYDTGWNWDELTYVDFWSLKGGLRHIFYNGFQPVFPWFSLFCIGIIAGRVLLKSRRVFYKIASGGFVVFLLITVLSLLITQFFLKLLPIVEIEEVLILFGLQSMPAMPQFVLSAGGMSLFILGLTLWVVDRISSGNLILKMLERVGKLSLTIYVSHVVVGIGFFEVFNQFNSGDACLAISGVIGYFLMSAVFSYFWLEYFSSGPLEWIFRKLTKIPFVRRAD